MKQLIADIAAIVGVASVLHGCYTAYPPLAFIVGGVVLVAFSIIGARRWA